jgi:hypothetical protein
MPDTKPVYYFNASLSKGSGACGRKRFWQGYLGLTHYAVNNDVAFGSAVHIFKAEMLCTNGNYRLALLKAKQYFETTPMIVKPNKSWMTSARLVEICILYWETVGKRCQFEVFKDPRDPSGEKRLVEQTFDIPVLETAEFDIHVCGTIDSLGKFPYGTVGICDLKTTSFWDQEAFLSAFGQTIQLKLYVWAIRKMAELSKNKQSLICQMATKPICAFIDAVFLDPPKMPVFRESDKFIFTDEQLAELEGMLMYEVEEYAQDISTFLRTGQEPKPTGLMYDSCATKYGLCEFFNVCSAPVGVAFDSLKSSFTVRKYKPLEFRKQENEQTQIS